MARKQASPPRRRLGKGLGSLISAPVKVEPKGDAESPPVDPAAVAGAADGLSSLPIALIRANPKQPRKTFDDKSLDALSASIQSAGVMQPIVVRTVSGGTYEIVAGERRWRAAQRAGLESIPAVIRTADDRQSAEWSLIENLQREDLNPIERAEAFRRLIDDFELRHQDVGELVGLDRSSVSNHLRLLELDDELQDLVRSGLLGQAHARALLAITNLELRRKIAIRAVREEWSVRAVEREAGRHSGARTAGGPVAPEVAPTTARRANLADLERRLSDHLGTRVRVRPGKKKGSGSLVIEFFDSPQFEGLIRQMGFRMGE
ncbi:MAG: ParB/RepB/Spo0J family partition protein [Planctomycetes bacterium]|nr:ParB/RepB/Spo0J family partition protein [Planctomycetota bacterium]